MIKNTLLVLLLFLSFSTFAQNFRLGFQASPHLTWMTSTKDDITRLEMHPGIKYGLEADIFLAGFPRYSLNTGLFVANHSFSANYNIAEPFYINDVTFNQAVDITYKLNYIEIPINIKLKSDQFYRMRFYGQFGLTNMINLSASATSSDSEFTGDNVKDGINRSVIRSYNLSMIMGGGVEYDVGGNTAINVGIQYSNGLTDVTDISALPERTILNSIRLVLGVMF
ncbi:MAG: porin family protein [Prolixibacteraceae bacterium]|jgi:hypothetical protein|nr:porin family protein [Prolixibacteraceae bacterium]